MKMPSGMTAAPRVVIDGATPLGDRLMPGPSDAAWIAQFGARRLMAHLRDGDGARKALRAALADTQKSFEALRRQRAGRDVADALRLHDAGGARPRGDVEFLWFGDCAALVKQGDAPVTVVGETFDKRAAEAAAGAESWRRKKSAAADRISRASWIVLRAAPQPHQQRQHWLFSPDVRAAAHVSRRIVKLKPGSDLLLASDGFLALASDYGAYGADSLMAAAMDKGLDGAGRGIARHRGGRRAAATSFRASRKATMLRPVFAVE